MANDITGTNPLPVELLSFDAKPNGNIVDVTWATASEINSHYFMVQRSKDGNVFEDVVKVNASGNSSSAKNYSAVDYEPYSGVSYYRLKEADNDGKITFSNVVSVSFGFGISGMSVYPNPTSGPFTINLTGQSEKQVLIVVRDVQGKEFYSKVVITSSDTEVIAVDPSGKLASGIYFVIATSDSNIFEKKIVIR